MSRGRRRAALAASMGAIALDSALLGVIAPLLPELEERTGASEAALGLALAFYSLPILLVSLPLGRLADRIGRRPVLIGGLLMTVAGSLLIVASPSLGAVLAGRAVQGTGAAASWIAALSIVSDLAPPGRRGQAIGSALAFNSAGAIGGPALGGVAAGEVSFEFPFLLISGLALGFAALAAVALPRRIPRTDEPVRARAMELARVLVGRTALPAAALVIFGALATGVIEVVVPLDGDERLGLGATAIGLMFGGAIAVNVLTAPLAGRSADLRGAPPVATLGCLLIALALALLATLDGQGGMMAGLVVYGLGSGIAFSAALPWLDEAMGEANRGLGYGFLNIIYGLGYGLGPALGGVGLALLGAGATYLIAGGAMVAVAVLVRLARGHAPAIAAAGGPGADRSAG